MERIVQKVDTARDAMTFRMAGTEERDAWMRTFPPDIPEGSHLVYEWRDLKLCFVIEPITETAARRAKSGAETSVQTGFTPEEDARRKELEQMVKDANDPKGKSKNNFKPNMGRKNLLTLCAELGIGVNAEKATEAQMIGLIVRKETANQSSKKEPVSV